MSERLTAAQMKFLQALAAHPLGVLAGYGTNNGLGSAARRRMVARLNAAGLTRNYVHGGIEITDAGRAALQPGAKE